MSASLRRLHVVLADDAMAPPAVCCSDEAAASATGPDCRGASPQILERTMFKRSVLFSGLALVVTSVSAQAQTATAAVSIEVAPVLSISSTGNFAFPVAGDAEYQAGSVASTAGPTLSHRANVPYEITIAAQSGSSFAFTAATGRSDADPIK